MQNSDELRLEILRLENKLSDCKAAIKDVIYCAEDTTEMRKPLYFALFSFNKELANMNS